MFLIYVLPFNNEFVHLTDDLIRDYYVSGNMLNAKDTVK